MNMKLIKKTAAEENLNNNIITMHNNGFDSETIAKALSLDISYVNEVLKNN